MSPTQITSLNQHISYIITSQNPQITALNPQIIFHSTDSKNITSLTVCWLIHCCEFSARPDLPTWPTYLPDLPTWPNYLTYLPDLLTYIFTFIPNYVQKTCSTVQTLSLTWAAPQFLQCLYVGNIDMLRVALHHIHRTDWQTGSDK